jgi:hypothetical protein
MRLSKPSWDFTERPPDTMRSASVRSATVEVGASVSTTDVSTPPRSAASDSTGAEEPVLSPMPKEFGRTVKSAGDDEMLTSTKALPA